MILAVEISGWALFFMVVGIFIFFILNVFSIAAIIEYNSSLSDITEHNSTPKAILKMILLVILCPLAYIMLLIKWIFGW